MAIDSQGNIAAATSTGGITAKRPGRVGDSPLIGCGAYADNQSVGVSCTGNGEAIAKITLARLVSFKVAWLCCLVLFSLARCLIDLT